MTDLTSDSLIRNDEVGGKAIATFKSGASKHFQGVVLVDPSGAPKGDAARPYAVSFDGVGIDKNLLCSDIFQVIRAAFDGVYNPKIVSVELLNAGGMDPTLLKTAQTGGLVMNAALATFNKISVKTKFEVPYVSGIGCVASFSCLLDNIASPISGQAKRMGIGDTNAGVFVEWTGSPGTLRLRSYIDGVVGIDIESTAWDTPVIYDGGSGLLKSGKVQRWAIRHDWATGRVIISLDGAQVHDYEPSGSLTTPNTNYRNGKATFEIENITLIGTANTAKLYAIEVLAPSASLLSGIPLRHANSGSVVISSGTPTNLLAIKFKEYRTIHGVKYRNNRIARIRKIQVSANATTATATDNLFPMPFYVLRNKELTTLSTLAKDETPVSPQVNFTGTAAPLVATVQVASATMSGYAAADTVMYKVSALGAYGETIANTTASASVSVGTPAKQVLLTMVVPLPNAVAYGIYRRKNGAGNYELIAYADPVKMAQDGFMDIGYSAYAALTAPGASTAEQESFMMSYTSFGVNNNTDGDIINMSASCGNVLETTFEDGQLNLYPGDTIVIYTGTNAVNMAASAAIFWAED